MLATPMHARSIGKESATPRARLGVLVRVLAAALGGYALAALASVVVALVYRAPREEAVAAATMPAFLLFAGAVLWAFAARTAWRACLGIGLPVLLLGALVWWLGFPTPAPTP